MQINKQHLSITKTARFFTLGNDQQVNNEILFVLHGYGMSAETFIKEFEPVVAPNRLIVAPEGLSRFYRKGFAGDVVASWMTKDDRSTEIIDYIHYLNQVYDQVCHASSKAIAIGFSQGASTASRWVMTGGRAFENLVLWCGEFAPDIDELNAKMTHISNVIGSEDEFISMDRFRSQSQFIESKGFEFDECVFEGKHEIHAPTLVKLTHRLFPRE